MSNNSGRVTRSMLAAQQKPATVPAGTMVISLPKSTTRSTGMFFSWLHIGLETDCHLGKKSAANQNKGGSSRRNAPRTGSNKRSGRSAAKGKGRAEPRDEEEESDNG